MIHTLTFPETVPYHHFELANVATEYQESLCQRWQDEDLHMNLDQALPLPLLVSMTPPHVPPVLSTVKDIIIIVEETNSKVQGLYII